MIVSNTTPLIYLGKLGYLTLLKALFKKICIPREVFDEILQLPESQEAVLLKNSIKEGWIIIEDVEINQLLMEFSFLEEGEIKAISLALKKGCMILIDDEIAKNVAKLKKLKVHGTLFVILIAYKKKLISKEEAIDIVESMSDYGFYLSTRMYGKFLRSLG